MTVRELSEKIERETLSPFATLSENSKGRLSPLEKCDMRTDFQRDRDRIIHSKSFRRLKHKTQVFLAPTGDHYRTRLTHTMEVSQIARTIARALRLNEDLTEAIALAHDLGHTPFGHSGENVLNEICPNGFRHYEQSLRVIDYLEDGKGLNLTFEVRDGVLNHAGDCEAKTLEGKIIKLADRIAYINHDIDDAIRGGIINADSIPKKCSEVLGNTHGERIDTLIRDIVLNSIDKPDIEMSDEVKSAMTDLRSFMFDCVYVDSVAKQEDKKAMDIICMLYDAFTKKPELMPDDTKLSIEKFGLETTVTDYIAGMTDNYAIHKFTKIYVPKKWVVD
ncbi:MAG: deoxyguanosinetriphosphate triphosphohydrolase [Clostridia bacterium]|nr:deoxyguanosinetriphosphate triphosphohydrolase [Clostridia bacterium]